MKLSDNTICILKNFSSINPSIYIRKGNTLRTIAMSGNIAATAKVSEDFENEFAIYDLNQFLNGLKLYENPELDFSDNGHILIKQGTHKIKYFLTDPTLIHSPEDRDIVLPSKDVCFKLDENQFEKLIRASSVFGLPDLSVVGEDGKIELQVRQKENVTSNEVSVLVGETDEEFCLNFKIENLKIIPGSYDVVISKQLIAEFSNQNFDLTYFVGLESDSSFIS
jgi:hypothetical protein